MIDDEKLQVMLSCEIVSNRWVFIKKKVKKKKKKSSKTEKKKRKNF